MLEPRFKGVDTKHIRYCASFFYQYIRLIVMRALEKKSS
nr:MAG TPA: hypothetical protein [Caudoviricetes sp.]